MRRWTCVVLTAAGLLAGGCSDDGGNAGPSADGAIVSPDGPGPQPQVSDGAAPTGDGSVAPNGGGRQYAETCGGAYGACAAGLICVQFNESGGPEGYCTAECSQTSPCPPSPAGGECAFQLTSSGKTICGFLCDAANPGCPSGLSCTYSEAGQYTYCSTDPPPQCGNNAIEVGEECDGSDLGNMSCKAFGYASGALACDNQCAFDKSGCAGPSSCSNLPPRDCTSGTAACSKLSLFSPTQGTGYEVTHGQTYSYVRQDTMMLIKYAAAAVSCMLPGTFPIGLGDMSMPGGGTPADAAGNLRHPQGTHENGQDVDIAYFQVGQQDNHLRPVCPHTTNGVEQYHCTGKPTILDAKRSALFVAKLLESSRVRVIGVDGQIGPLLEAEAQKLQAQGMISTATLNAFAQRLAYEPTNTGAGWYQFHHHHMHLSTWSSAYSTPETAPPTPPFAPEAAAGIPPMVFPARPLGLDQRSQPPVAPLDRPTPGVLGAYPALLPAR